VVLADIADTGFVQPAKEVVMFHHEAAVLTAPTVSRPACPIAVLVALNVCTKALNFPLDNRLHMGGMDDALLVSNNFGTPAAL
jgi:L-alanine-DL-glutamate epimerase-like enolase superfamily enzyme